MLWNRSLAASTLLNAEIAGASDEALDLMIQWLGSEINGASLAAASVDGCLKRLLSVWWYTRLWWILRVPAVCFRACLEFIVDSIESYPLLNAVFVQLNYITVPSVLPTEKPTRVG